MPLYVPGAQGLKRIGRTSRHWSLGGRAIPPAAQPSLLGVDHNHIVDEYGRDLGIFKGLNNNCASTVGGESFTFSQTEYTANATLTNAAVVPGPGIDRIPCHWDVFEQTSAGAGRLHGITSATGAPTAGSAIESLDFTLARILAAGRYAVIDIHLLGGVGPNFRCPTWAQTGTSPSGSGNAWTWFITNGANLVQTLASRYGDPTSPYYNKALCGICPNEPPSVVMAEIMTGFEALVPWYNTRAPGWMTWIEPTAYGNGTPYPSGATAIDTARLLALGKHIVVSWHDYLVDVGSNGLSYQSNGSIGPEQQVGGVGVGAKFWGWGTAYTYPDTTASRTALTNHHAPFATLRAVSPRIALFCLEFGGDNPGGSGEAAWVRDTVNSKRAVGFCGEVWWQKGTSTTGFNSGSTTNTGWRTVISGTSWMTNATARVW